MVPDEHTSPTDATAPTDDELADRRRELQVVLDAFAVALAADGGDLVVERVDVAAGELWVTMAGACGSCGVAEVSTQAGMRRILADRFAWFTELHVAMGDDEVAGTGGWQPRHLAEAAGD